MTPRLLLAALVLLSACAHGEPRLPRCDGLARRPANPHGSILTEAATPLTPAAPPTVPASVEPPSAAGGCA